MINSSQNHHLNFIDLSKAPLSILFNFIERIKHPYLLATLLIILLSSSSGFAAALNLPKDSQGWNVFSPASDSRIMYVSASGNDSTGRVYTQANHPDWSHPQNPTGTINAFATYAAAYAQTRAGYPDWVLFKRGDTFIQTVGSNIRSGRSATEPFFIGAYGSSGASPLLKTGIAAGLWAMGNKAWVAVSGIDFYAHTRNPSGGEYTGTSGDAGFWFLAQSIGEKIQGILIEGCKFRFYTFGIVMNGYQDVIDGITFYRNVITDSYVASGGNSQGIYVYRIKNIVIKENVFDHNGWYSKAGTGGVGEATMFGHSTYVNECINVTMDANVIARAASSSSKFRSDANNGSHDIVVNNNLQVGGETGFAFNGQGGYATQFSNLTITNNVITNLGYPQATNRTLAWGFELNGVATVNLSGNYIIDQTNTAINNCYGIETNNLLTDATINDNVFYNFYNAIGLRILDPDAVSTISNITFSRNKIQLSNYSGYTISAGYNPAGKWIFSRNEYYSNRSPSNRYILNGADITLATWQAATGDTSTFTQSTFPDPSRNITSYMTSVGGTGTLDAFFLAIRSQDKFSWDSRFSAAVINSWIKAGFTSIAPSPSGLIIAPSTK